MADAFTVRVSPAQRAMFDALDAQAATIAANRALVANAIVAGDADLASLGGATITLTEAGLLVTPAAV